MASYEHYKRYAMQCLEMARAVSDERQRAFLIEMAHAWKKLADHAAANKNLQDAPVIEEPDRGD